MNLVGWFVEEGKEVKRGRWNLKAPKDLERPLVGATRLPALDGFLVGVMLTWTPFFSSRLSKLVHRKETWDGDPGYWVCFLGKLFLSMPAKIKGA